MRYTIQIITTSDRIQLARSIAPDQNWHIDAITRKKDLQERLKNITLFWPGDSHEIHVYGQVHAWDSLISIQTRAEIIGKGIGFSFLRTEPTPPHGANEIWVVDENFLPVFRFVATGSL